MASKFHNAPNRSKPVEQAFREKYLVDPGSGCWIWQASFMRTGYGQFNARNGRIVTAHRFSFELHKGAIPDGLFVCHTCDNRACVNPDHLWLGTCAENLADMRSKGRAVIPDRKGEANGQSKITEDDALFIKSSSDSLSVLSKRFGITKTSVSNIKNGKTWRHLPRKNSMALAL